MTDRIPLDHLTSDQYDELCERLERYEEVLGGLEGRAEAALARMRDQLEVTRVRVRALHRKSSHGDTCVYCAHGQRLGYDTTWPCDTIRALDGVPSAPATAQTTEPARCPCNGSHHPNPTNCRWCKCHRAAADELPQEPA